jgi:hypothetical protein
LGRSSGLKYALRVCANDLRDELTGYFRLTELERSRFEVKQREMRAEETTIRSHAVDQLRKAVDAFQRGDLERHLTGASQTMRVVERDRLERVEDYQPEAGNRPDERLEREEIDRGYAENRVLRSDIFHRHYKLDNQPPARGEGEESGERLLGQGVTVISRVKPDPAELVDFVAAAQVFFPVRKDRVHRAEGNEPLRVGLAAIVGQPGIDTRHIALEQALKAANPRLLYKPTSQPVCQGPGVFGGEPAERPAAERDIRIDHGRFSVRTDAFGFENWSEQPAEVARENEPFRRLGDVGSQDFGEL